MSEHTFNSACCGAPWRLLIRNGRPRLCCATCGGDLGYSLAQLDQRLRALCRLRRRTHAPLPGQISLEQPVLPVR